MYIPTERAAAEDASHSVSFDLSYGVYKHKEIFNTRNIQQWPLLCLISLALGPTQFCPLARFASEQKQ